MKMPRSVWVGPHRYEIWNSETSWVQRPAEEEHQVGLSVHTTSDIYVKPGLSAGQSRDTLLHEILHAIFAVAPPTNYTILGDELEEHLCCQLSPALLLLMQDPRNRPVWNYLRRIDD